MDDKLRALRRLTKNHLGTTKPLTQADRVVLRFGGVKALTEALAAIGKPRSIVTIYRWNHPKEKGGMGGVIPSCALPDILEAARHEGILLTSDELDPRPTAFREKDGPMPTKLANYLADKEKLESLIKQNTPEEIE